MKIRSISQLEAEKKRIRQHQEALEKKIRQNWQTLKVSLRPANVLADTASAVFRKKTEATAHGNGWWKDAFIFGITLLTKKMLGKRKQAAPEKEESPS
ncbi:MAG: hypothetical protein U0X40_06425 [Ferruginibacter sp.]